MVVEYMMMMMMIRRSGVSCVPRPLRPHPWLPSSHGAHGRHSPQHPRPRRLRSPPQSCGDGRAPGLS